MCHISTNLEEFAIADVPTRKRPVVHRRRRHCGPARALGGALGRAQPRVLHRRAHQRIRAFAAFAFAAFAAFASASAAFAFAFAFSSSTASLSASSQ